MVEVEVEAAGACIESHADVCGGVFAPVHACGRGGRAAWIHGAWHESGRKSRDGRRVLASDSGREGKSAGSSGGFLGLRTVDLLYLGSEAGFKHSDLITQLTIAVLT